MTNKQGWVGVDLDGTLAVYDIWRGVQHIGEPIMPVVEYVKLLRKNDVEVRIFTARVQEGQEAVHVIERWSLWIFGEVLNITDRKDMDMVFLIDDRAVTVERNTGKLLAIPPSLADIRKHWNNPSAPPVAYSHD